MALLRPQARPVRMDELHASRRPGMMSAIVIFRGRQAWSLLFSAKEFVCHSAAFDDKASANGLFVPVPMLGRGTRFDLIFDQHRPESDFDRGLKLRNGPFLLVWRLPSSGEPDRLTVHHWPVRPSSWICFRARGALRSINKSPLLTRRARPRQFREDGSTATNLICVPSVGFSFAPIRDTSCLC